MFHFMNQLRLNANFVSILESYYLIFVFYD